MMTPMPSARRLLAAPVVALALVLLASCGDAGKLETSRASTKIPSELRKTYRGVQVGKTTCTPVKVKLAAGVPFSCVTTIEGQTVHIAVVQDDQKGNVSFTLDKGIVVSVERANDLVKMLSKPSTDSSAPSLPPPSAADCPGPAVRVLDKLQSFQCSVTISGAPTPYQVILCDLPAHFTYLPGETVADPAATCRSTGS
jgi:hypothetical protein